MRQDLYIVKSPTRLPGLKTLIEFYTATKFSPCIHSAHAPHNRHAPRYNNGAQAQSGARRVVTYVPSTVVVLCCF